MTEADKDPQVFLTQVNDAIEDVNKAIGQFIEKSANFINDHLTEGGILGGFYLGAGLSAILFAQPLIYLGLGLCWALVAFGRFISMLSDGGNTLRNWVRLVIDAVLGALALTFALGLVA